MISMEKQNQHYVNKSLIKRFSNNGETINTVHLYHQPQFIEINGCVRKERFCKKVSDINENVAINEMAFCSQDDYSKSERFWDPHLEQLLNDKIENNLITKLDRLIRQSQDNINHKFLECPFLKKYGITVYELNVNSKLKSKINAFCHILTVSSHYELFQSEASLMSFVNSVNDGSRANKFENYKLLYIKFDETKSIGRLILNEFPARYRNSLNRLIDYSNPPIDNCDLLFGDYEMLLMCQNVEYLYSFLFGNIVFDRDNVNLLYSSCISYYNSIKKSLIFASSDISILNEFVELFNSNEFREYISIPENRNNIIQYYNNEIIFNDKTKKYFSN